MSCAQNKSVKSCQSCARFETELLDLQERLGAAEDVQRRTDVISPADGVVVDMQITNVGAVIQPGERLLDVVPGNEKTRD